MTVGQKITLRRPVRPWYSGYGMNPDVMLPAGCEGTITHTDAPYVTRRGTFAVARFTFKGQSWQVGFDTATREAF